MKTHSPRESGSDPVLRTDTTSPAENPYEYPPLRLAHLRTLTNNSGIIQHGLYSMPNEQTGYCTDDNCRAFLAAVQAYRRLPDPELLRLIGLYLSFLRAARNERGAFRNFMSYQQFFLDEEGSEDCVGRTLWSLAYAVRFPTPRDGGGNLSGPV